MYAKIYTLPNCPNCVGTKKYLQKNNIEYKEYPLNHPAFQEERTRFKNQGIQSAPVVELYHNKTDPTPIHTFYGQTYKNDPLQTIFKK